MLKNYLPVSRTQYEALLRELEAAEHERDAAFAERMDIEQERDKIMASLEHAITDRDAAASQAYAAECDRHAARKERGEVATIATRALTMLAEVNATRTGGKVWDEKRTALFTDAKVLSQWSVIMTDR